MTPIRIPTQYLSSISFLCHWTSSKKRAGTSAGPFGMLRGRDQVGTKRNRGVHVTCLPFDYINSIHDVPCMSPYSARLHDLLHMGMLMLS
jgi:hypothetical protein